MFVILIFYSEALTLAPFDVAVIDVVVTWFVMFTAVEEYKDPLAADKK
jgi:hypothetical protein